MRSNRWSRTVAAARPGAVLAGAAWLAFASTLSALRSSGWEERPCFPAEVDETLAPLRRGLHAGERIAVALPPSNGATESALWFAAQYALAPAVVEPIFLSECIGERPGARCRLDRATLVAVPAGDDTTITFLRQRLGVVPVGVAGRVPILGAEPR